MTFVYTLVTGLKEVPRTSTVKSLDVKMYKANAVKYGVIHFVSLLPIGAFKKLAFSQSSPQDLTCRSLRPWTEKHLTWPVLFPAVACHHGQGQDDVLYVKVENKQQASVSCCNLPSRFQKPRSYLHEKRIYFQHLLTSNLHKCWTMLNCKWWYPQWSFSWDCIACVTVFLESKSRQQSD